MSHSFIKKPDNGPHSALAGLGVLASEQPRPPCTVCGTPWEKHGSYPTCASHPYSPDGRCGHVGIFADGRFTGAPCAGAECKNGCVGASGVPGGQDQVLMLLRRTEMTHE